MNAILTRDMLMNMLLGLVALVIVLSFIANPPADTSPNAITPPGSIAISAVWKEGPIDVDLWALAPGQQIATGYSARSGKVFSLLRDDLGSSNDTSPLNFENIFGRAMPAGEYVVNVHCYSCQALTVVHVEVSIGNGGYMHLLVSEDVELKPMQERTVVRFKLGAGGSVVPGSVGKVYKPLRSVRK
jgi:hypothetical protein